MLLTTPDILIFTAYCLIILCMGFWVSRDKKGHEKNSDDYFLAGKSLGWWAIGASLIASNISAEQFIGMSGSGFVMGLAIASYEWMAAATLLVVGTFFLPVFLKMKIRTMPQFLEERYDSRVSTVMAFFWFLLYLFVNLTSVLYLGALSLQTILGIPLLYAIAGLALFALLYSIYGGLKAVALTDVVQVVFLVAGGLATTWVALRMVGQEDALRGFSLLLEKAPDHFHMIFEKGERVISDGNGSVKDPYMDLPGLTVLFGAMWVVNLNYWGFNQYITQRALAAKSLNQARWGIVFAAALKLLMPLLVVIPGIAAWVLYQEASVDDPIYTGMTHLVDNNGVAVFDVKPDRAYPVLLSLLPAGLKGLAFAALTAAIISSLSSMANSASTIFTLDIYKKFRERRGITTSESSLVTIGRIVVVIAFLVAVPIATQLESLGQVFQFIQEYSGFVSPGIFAIFLFGFFWKRTTALAALTAALLTVPLSAVFKFATPEIPFLDRIGWVFLIISAIIWILSIIDPRAKNNPDAVGIERSMFRTSISYKVVSLVILIILTLLYVIFW